MTKTAKMFLLLFAVLFLNGCSFQLLSEPGSPLCQVVTQVDVVYENGSIHVQRQYTSQEKMQNILNYLRAIDPYGTPAEDPQTAQGSDYYILVSYSDAHRKLYHQKADRFFQMDGEQWQKIDPHRAQELGYLIGKMESDGAAMTES